MHCYLEVIDKANNSRVEVGQLLPVIKETPSFYFVRALDGVEIKVSKKTRRGCSCTAGFWRRNDQPTFDFSSKLVASE